MSAITLTCAAVAGSGCGDEEEAQPSGPQVRLLVTRDFGREVLDDKRLSVDGHGTALSLLREEHDIAVDEFGNVRSIDGQRAVFAPEELKTSTRWNFIVNGVKNPTAPANLPVLEGDTVQFDFEDVLGSEDIRGNVSAFPQPFSAGIGGRRFPVTLVCADGYADACRRVRRVFTAAGVDTSGRPPADRLTQRERRVQRATPTPRRARILVGSWAALADRPTIRRVERGPDYGGVFADFAQDGRSVRLLDAHSRPAHTMGAGTGLLAFARPGDATIAWLVIGVDRKGVARAARAIDPETLDNAFSVAVSDEGVARLPLPASRD